MRFQNSRTIRFTNSLGDSQVIPLGQKVRIYNISIISGDAVDFNSSFKDGGSSGDAYIKINVPAGGSTNHEMGKLGVLFTDGCNYSDNSTAIGANKISITYRIDN